MTESTQNKNPFRLSKDPTEVLKLMIDLGIINEQLEPSGEFHRRWHRYIIAVSKNPFAKAKAEKEGIDITGACLAATIVSFFPDGVHEDDLQIIYNAIYERLEAIPAIPYKP